MREFFCRERKKKSFIDIFIGGERFTSIKKNANYAYIVNSMMDGKHFLETPIIAPLSVEPITLSATI